MSACAGSSKNLKDLNGDVIRKEAWLFYRTISGVRLCWELEEPERPKGPGEPGLDMLPYPIQMVECLSMVVVDERSGIPHTAVAPHLSLLGLEHPSLFYPTSVSPRAGPNVLVWMPHPAHAESRLREGRSVCLCWAFSKPKGPKVQGEGRKKRGAERTGARGSGKPEGRSRGWPVLRSLSTDPEKDWRDIQIKRYPMDRQNPAALGSKNLKDLKDL